MSARQVALAATQFFGIVTAILGLAALGLEVLRDHGATTYPVAPISKVVPVMIERPPASASVDPIREEVVAVGPKSPELGDVSGVLRLAGNAAPPTVARVILFPSAMNGRGLLDALREIGWKSSEDRSIYVADSDGDGRFVASAVRDGASFQLAVFGHGLVATHEASGLKAGDHGIVVPVAYAYGTKVTAVDDQGRAVHLFSPGTAGAIGGVKWRFSDLVNQVTRTNPSFDLLLASPTVSNANGDRLLLAVSSNLADTLGEVTVDVALPGYSPSTIVAPLSLLDECVSEWRATLERSSESVGDLCVRFVPEETQAVPEGKVRLSGSGSGNSLVFPIHPNMLEPRRRITLRGIPRGDYQVDVSWNSVGRWIPSENGVQVSIREDSPAEFVVDTSRLLTLSVKLAGEEAAAALASGLYVQIGDGRRNAGKDLLKMRFHDLRPAYSDVVKFDGIDPGYYCVAAFGSGVLAVDWVTVGNSDAELTLTPKREQ